MTARRVGAAFTLLLSLTLLVVATVDAARFHAFASLFPPDFGAGLSCAVVGAYLLVRAKVLSLAVILCVQGCTASLTSLTGVVRDVAARGGPLHGAPLFFAWMGEWSWLPGVVLLVPLVLLFPDGRLTGRFWRWLLVTQLALAGVIVVLGVGGRYSLVDGTPYAFAPNPTAFLGALPTTVLDRISETVFATFFVILAVSLGSVFVRRRHAGRLARAQLTCLAFGTTVTIVLITTGEILGSLPANWWIWLISLLAVAPIPVSIGVAVLRYRLYEIDRVVSRTVTYALVLVVLASVYVGIVAGLAELVPPAYGQVGVAAATLAVSALAVPLTRRLRRAVDRRFNRARFDADGVVTAFAARLRARPDRGDVPGDLLEVLHRTVQPSHAGVWVLPGVGSAPEAAR